MSAVSNCVKKMKMLEGLPPYNTMSNYVQGDGYFAASIRRDYSKKTQAAAEEIVRKLR